MKSRLFRLLGLLAGVTIATATVPATAVAQKALVYCPVGTDVTGCDNVAAALGSEFPGGVDRAYDGTSNTIDLKTADLWDYAVLVVPSLADGSERAPYGLLRDAAVSERLHDAVMGRVALWSGTPDQGSANRELKDALIRSIARWAKANYGAVKGPGLVAFQDLSDDVAARYSWVKPIAAVNVTADPAVNSYASVRTLTATATAILGSGTSQIAYANMASLGFYLPEGVSGVTLDAVGQTGTTTGGQVVLLTSPGGNTGGALVKTDKDDYAPGETVTITGSGFQAGETVNIVLHEDPVVHENRTLTATADGNGAFVNTSFAPEAHDLGVRFVLTATGAASGKQAQTTFTDGGFVVTSSTGTTFTASTIIYPASATSCPATPPGGSTAGTLNVTSAGANFGIAANGRFGKLTIPVQSNEGSAYLSAAASGNEATLVSNTLSASGTTRELCIQSNNGSATNLGTLTVTYGAPPPANVATQLAVSAASGTFGGTIVLSAKLTAGATILGNQDVTFTLNGTSVGTAKTDGTTGVATLSGVSLSGINAGSYPTGVAASFAAVTGYLASNGTAALTIAQATQTISFAPLAPKNFGDPAFDVSATATSGLPVSFALGASAGCSISGSTVTITAATTTPEQCVIVASQAGNANVAAAMPVAQGFSIGRGTATLALTTPAYSYDNTAKAATSSTTPTGLTVTYVYKQGTTVVPAPTAAGSYDVTATINDANYSGTATGVLAIAQATPAFSELSGPSITYGTATTALGGKLAAGALIPPGGVSVTLGTGGAAVTESATLGADGSFSASFSTAALTPAVGSYPIAYSFAGDNNFASASDNSKTLTVTKAQATVSLDNLAHTYDGAAKAATASASPSGATGTITIAYSQNGQLVQNTTNAGSYDVTATLADANYDAQNATGTLVIAQATQTITFGALANRTFGDAPFAVAATSSVNLDVAFTSTGACTLSGNTITITGAGDCTVTAAQAGDGNYSPATNVEQKFTIAKATPTVAWTTPASITYGTALGTDQLNATSGSVAGGFVYAPTAGTVLGAGTQTLNTTFTPADAANYNGAAASVTLTVNKAAQAITFGALGNKTYGDAAFDVDVSGGASANGVTLSGTGACTITGANVTITSAGTCSITAAQAGDDNYLDAENVTRTFEVARAALTVTTDSKTRSYGTANPELTGSVTGQVNGDAITATYATAATAASGVETYPITATVTGDDLANYDVANAGGTLTITKAALTVTAASASRFYGDENPSLGATYDGFVLGETAAALGGTLSVGTAATKASSIGDYPVTVSGRTSDNYEIGYVAGTLTVTKAALTIAAESQNREYGDGNTTLTGSITGIKNGDGITATYTTAADAASAVGNYDIVPSAVDASPTKIDNYDVTLTNGALTVTAAPLSVTPANASRVYGAANPVLDGAITGIKNNDAITATYSVTADATSSVGDYPITATFAGDKLGNYVPTLNVGQLTITQAPLAVKAADQTKVYGSPNPALTGTVEGLLNSDPITVTYSTTATDASDAGSYDIVPAVQDGGNDRLKNYAVTPTNGALVITKAALTVTADNQTRVYGAANPTFTANYAGFVLGQTAETPAVLGGTLAFGGPATLAGPRTDVGSYVITPGGLTSGNYDITFADGAMVVTTAALAVKADDNTRVYGDANPSFIGTLTGVVEGDNVTASYASEAVPASPVGPYAIVPSLSDEENRLGNYAVTPTNGTLTVTPAPLTITATDASRIYGGANPTFIGEIDGLKNGDGITAAYTTTASPASDVGSYDIVPTAVDASPARLGNYAVTLVQAQLTITQATPTVVWATPAPVPQGTALSGTQLNATIVGVGGANVLGGFGYVPPSGTAMYVVGSQTLSTAFTSTDKNYTGATGSVQLSVTNVAPVVTSISLLDKPIALGTSASVTAQFTDPGMNDTHTATITWDDGQSSAGTVSNRTVTGSHSYTAPGVYTVTVTVTDNNAGTGSRSSSQETVAYVVIYDPSAGFVTGGGWIDSPAGACKLSTCTELTTGKASFGFNAKYKKGSSTPDGNTEFQFKAGGLNFKSTNYQWLVVTGGSKAQYKGTGTINGSGSYTFIITAIDGEAKGTGKGPDAFRIKISGAGGTVYDNKMNSTEDSDDATLLSGGSIQIHQ